MGCTDVGLTLQPGLRIKPTREQTKIELPLEWESSETRLRRQDYHGPNKDRNCTATKRAPRTLAGTIPPTNDNARTQIVGHYEAALRLMQEGKYDKAHAAFDKMLAAGAGELSERVRMYSNACCAADDEGKEQLCKL